MRLEIIARPSALLESKTPLLFVHGACAGAWCWDEHFLPYFASLGYPSYAVSLRGHGNSEGRDALHWTTINDYVADLEQAAASLPAPPVIVGHSMGGLVTQKYLERRSAPAAALLASFPASGFFGAGAYWLWQTPLVWTNALALMTAYQHHNGEAFRPALAHALLFSKSAKKADVERWAKKLRAESMQAFCDMTLAAPRPERVRTPLLVLGAENDAIFPYYEIERTAQAYNAPHKIFPNMAHAMMLEKDWKDVADCIAEWLASQGL